MESEEYRGDSEVEPDSDHEDGEGGGGEGYCSNGGWVGHPLQNFSTDLDSYETGTVRRRTKTIVTPKMAMESFRLSFLNDDQDVNFDAILGELYELESQLNSTQTELSRNLGGSTSTSAHPPPPVGFQDEGVGEQCGSSETLHVSEQEELDQLAAEITRGLPSLYVTNGMSSGPPSSMASPSSHPQHHHHYHSQLHHPHLTIGGLPTPGGLYPPMSGEGMSDAAETDSAYSDNASLPSSESFTSMATVSSSADTTSSSSGETCSMSSAICGGPLHSEEQQIARVKAEKIRIALEKIREAKIRKLFVRAFAKDGSSKSILVDEKMSVSQVCSQLADKNHVRLNHKLAVVEHMPELLMERILEDHDSLVESMVMWTRDSKNKIMFEERMDKYDLFRNPEKYLLNASTVKQASLSSAQKDRLIQEFFEPEKCVPPIEGALYLKSDGKKAWKKFFFVLRASGLYYNPKGKTSKNPKDLACLVQFDYVEVYKGLGWKKKYHAPSDFCFALKHPQIQKKTSKYIRYFCADSETSLDQWVMGIRTVKLGKQMLHNYERLTHEISTWDLRPPDPSSSTAAAAVAADEGLCHMLNHADLSDSRMSVPEPGARHSVIQVHNSSLVRNPGSGGVSSSSSKDVLSIEVVAMPTRKGSAESGTTSDGRSLSGSVSSGMSSESGHKTPIKRVSFSATHSIINGDSGEQTVKHRDSIISASTDSSEDSNSSGEMRASFRGKMRPRLPLTTETTRQLADMCNVSMDETPEAVYAETHHRGVGSGSSVSSLSSSSSFARSDRRRASMQERRGSSECAAKSGQAGRSSMKQASLDSGDSTLTRKNKYNSEAGDSHYTHVRRKSEPSVADLITMGKEEATYSHVYSPLPNESTSESAQHSKLSAYEAEPIYNQIRNTKSATQQQSSKAACDMYSSSPHPSSQFDNNHIAPPLPPPLQHMDHESSPPLPPPPPSAHVQHMQVPPPPPPTPLQKTQKSPPAIDAKPSVCQTSLSGPSQNQAKATPPATLPKPNCSMNTPPPPPPITGSSDNSIQQAASLPKTNPPPPPLRLCSNESTCSTISGYDSLTGSPLHIPMPPPMPPLNPKLPPPTMPKSTAHPRMGPPPPPPPPSALSTSTPSSNSGLSTPNNGLHVSSDLCACPSQSPSLPFLSELSKQQQGQNDNRSSQSQGSNQQHRRSASSGGGGSSQKGVPPPPPKRSENTRLSGEVFQRSVSQSSPSPSPSVHNGSPAMALHAPIYENYDGMMDIDELPPPPPELLMDLNPSETCDQRTSGKKQPPPPPPKRSKDTQLSSH